MQGLLPPKGGVGDGPQPHARPLRAQSQGARERSQLQAGLQEILQVVPEGEVPEVPAAGGQNEGKAGLHLVQEP